MITGIVLRRHAGGYLVFADELRVSLLCPVRGRLKKEGMSIYTGDRVELAEVSLAAGSEEQGAAVIVRRLERKNLLSLPHIANIDQVLIVLATHQPEWNALLCDRYLVHLQLELPATGLFICLNKCDLSADYEIEAIRSIYEFLGYQMFVVSAKTGAGLEELKSFLAHKTSVLTGPSGVGKSSLINALNPQLKLKVDINEDLLVGRHTTTASELYRLSFNKAGCDLQGWVADTPGSSLGELKYPDPTALTAYFPELTELARECKFADCLHYTGKSCNVLANLEKIFKSRYESYLYILGQAQDLARHKKATSQKVETGIVKHMAGKEGTAKTLPILSGQYRARSRKNEKQKLNKAVVEGEKEFYEDS